METDTAPNPAAEAAHAEYSKVMSDPTHPHYEGLQRGDESALNYIANLYKGVSGPISTVVDAEVFTPRADTPPAQSPAPGFSVVDDREERELAVTGGDDPEERLQRAQEHALASVRQDLGEDFEPDIVQTPEVILAALQQEWGDQTPQNFAGVMNLREQLIQKDPQLVAETAMLVGDIRALKLLQRLRQVLGDLRG
jgi:hypothetical protein